MLKVGKRTFGAAAAFASVSALAFPASAQLLSTTQTVVKQVVTPVVQTVAPTTTAAPGPVRPYGGNLRPFYGNLRPFGGNLRPFYGNLRPFWGNLRPFWGDTGAFYGDLKSFWAVDNPVVGAGAPDYLKVGDYWTSAGGTWDQVFNNWNSQSYTATAGSLKTMVDGARDFWGASVTAKTGKSFDEGFANAMLAKYGIDLKDPASLSKLDEVDRAMFFLDWYDGLMNFTGTDHVDHWMKAINWTPALTRVQTNGDGADVRIGILDQSIVGADLKNGQVVQFNGASSFTDGHGAGVASLLVGQHDGSGVMGIAPNAKVFAYNPFDASGTANWSDVADGVRKLKASGASVVNMSLGVPGVTFDQGWNDVFSSLSTTLILKNTVFVIAAGNDGVTQTKNVQWGTLNPAFILVGSVDVAGNVSTFSNRPGDACLTTLLDICLPGAKLKDRYIVAPGEMILVSDGKGGLTRQIGTSFAAPLVSGAIALLHDRWPWLANYPKETVDIILRSAKDLGAPGTDDVYGRGMLDVEASQSPLDFNSLVWFSVENGQTKPQTASAVLNSYKNERQKTWDAKGAYFYAFETIGLTKRDFAIPLSQKLVGQNVTTYNGAKEQFQAYIVGRIDDWARGKTGYSARGSAFGFTSAVANPWGADLSVSVAPFQPRQGFRDGGLAWQSAYHLQTERSAVTFGFGDGAPALAQSSGFAQAGDYDIDRGGANPLLGLASGGGYAGWSYKLSPKWSLSSGALMRDQQRDTHLLPALRIVGNGAERYEADAQHVSLSYKPVDGLSLTGAYTRLHEGSALLGIQSFDPADFRDGTVTDGYSVSVNWAATDNLSLMATGTMGRTREGGESQSLAIGRDGVTTSSFQVGMARTHLFTQGDRLQLTLSQPMYVEKGSLDVTTVQVVDRQTGEIGSVTQRFDIAGKRRIAGEALYLRPVADGMGDVAFFGRVETQGGGATGESFTTGARYRIAF